MNALVIFYSGELPTKTELESAIAKMGFIASPISAHTLSGDNVARLLLRTGERPKQNTEEGDNAIIMLAGLTRMTNSSQFIVDIFDAYVDGNDAILRCCSILAQGFPYTKGVAKKYGFTEDMLVSIKRMHTKYNHV